MTDEAGRDFEPVAVELPTVDDTQEFGRRLATVLRPGDLVILDGPLGAGKTVLAQGIGAGLGVRGVVTSPTFVIARVHRPDPQRGGQLPLVHVDAYRLAASPRSTTSTSTRASTTRSPWSSGARARWSSSATPTWWSGLASGRRQPGRGALRHRW